MKPWLMRSLILRYMRDAPSFERREMADEDVVGCYGDDAGTVTVFTTESITCTRDGERVRVPWTEITGCARPDKRTARALTLHTTRGDVAVPMRSTRDVFCLLGLVFALARSTA